MTRPAQHPASNSESRKRSTPEPTCLPCGNKIPGFADALATARAEGAAEALREAADWFDVRGDYLGVQVVDALRAAAQAGEVRRKSIVCMDYPNCDREHAGGAGGTPVHPPADAVICPGNYDCPTTEAGEVRRDG